MKALFSAFLQASIYGSVIILIVLLLRLVLQKAPRKVLCLFWLLAGLRLLLPFQLESSVSLQPKLDARENEAIVFTQPEQLPLPQQPAPSLPAADIPEQLPVSSGAMPSVATPTTEAAPPDLMAVLAVVWLAVAGLALVYTLVSYVLLRQRVWDAVRCKDGAWECSRLQDAFVLGYFRPRIYLPSGLPEADRGLILLHEQAHIKRGDNWWKLLGFLCVCLHWFNPLVWLGFWLLCRDIEIACDEFAVRDMDLKNRKAYSEVLLSFNRKRTGLPACPVAFGEVSLLVRIRRVLQYRKAGLWVTALGVVLAALVAVCFLTSPAARTNKKGGAAVPTENTVSTEPSSQVTVPQTEPDPTIPSSEPAHTPPEGTVPVVQKPDTPSGQPSTTPTEPKPDTPTEPKPETPSVPSETPTAPPDTPTAPPQTPSEPPAVNPAPTVVDGGHCSGYFGTWQLTSDGTLTISGTGRLEESNNYPWTAYADRITRIVISEGIDRIPKSAFWGMTKAREIRLPSTVARIGESAFFMCSALERITIPAAVTVLQPTTFYGCTRLSRVDFASGSRLDTVGEKAFYGSSITAFYAPPALRVIESNAFLDCTALQTIDLTGSVESLGAKCFSGCTALRSVTLGATIRSAGGYVFYNCKAIEYFACHATIPIDGFTNLKSLRTLIYGGQNTTIPSFSGCTALSSVTITAPVRTMDSTFEGCSSLTGITLPETLRSIGNNTFRGTGITAITIPASVEEMGWAVFFGSPLNQITFRGSLPRFANSNVFSGASGVTAYYPAGNASWSEEALLPYGGTDIIWTPY